MFQIIAALLLVIGYSALLRGLIIGQEKAINGYSFLIWGTLSLCLNLLSKEPSIDKSIWAFTLIMAGFQYLIAVVSISKRQYAKINKFEIAAVIIAASSMSLWYLFKEQMGFWPMALIIVADICAICPSVLDLSKTKNIENDFLVGFALFGVVATLVTLGLDIKNPQSLAYPVFEICVNFGIMLYALYRRRALGLMPA